MMTRATRRLAIFAPFLLVLLTLVLTAGNALAAPVGSAKLKSREVQEVSGAWHVFVTIELPKPPPIPHQPMRFVFTKTMVYERALTDDSKEPVINRQALQNQPPSSEALDVDFANPQGKIFKGTNFDFGLTRVRGYEAGEYKLQIRTADGLDIGAPMTLILKGDNPVVDRRSITFEAKKKGIEKIGDGSDAGTGSKNPNGDAPEGNYTGEVAPVGSGNAFIPSSAYNATEEEKVKEKPGGCGCSVPGIDGSARAASIFGSLATLVILGAIARRRRRS
jgi:MYXO-CTERM domain-containing protein